MVRLFVMVAVALAGGFSAQAQYLDNLGANFETEATVIVQGDLGATSEVLAISTKEDGTFFVVVRVSGDAGQRIRAGFSNPPYLVGVMYDKDGNQLWAEAIAQAIRPTDSRSFTTRTGAKSSFLPNGDVVVAAHIYAHPDSSWGHQKRPVLARLRGRDGRVLWRKEGDHNKSDTEMNMVDMTVVGNNILVMQESRAGSGIQLVDGSRIATNNISITSDPQEPMSRQEGYNRSGIRHHWSVIRVNGQNGSITHREQGGVLEQWQTAQGGNPARQLRNTSDGLNNDARVLSSDFSPFGRYVYLSTNAFVHNSSAIKPKPTSADNDLILRFNGVGQIDSFWEVRRAGAALLHTLPDGDVLLAQHKQGTSKLTRFSSSGTQKWSTTFSSSAPCHQLLRDAISVICLPRRLARGALYPKFLLSSGDRLDGLRFPASSPARVPAQAVASGPSGKVIFGGPLSRTNGSLTLVQRKAGETVLLRPDLSGQDRTATVQRRNVPFLPLFQRDYKCRVHVTTGLRAPYEVVVELASSGEEVARQTVTDQSVPSFELLHGKEYNITARENQGSGRTVSSTVTPSCVVNLQ